MSHSHFEMPPALYDAYAVATNKQFYPSGTVRCSGVPMFRTQLARDLGCLLDVDRSVVAWTCLPRSVETGDGPHVFDFLVTYDDGAEVYFDAAEDAEDVPDVTEAAAIVGLRHCFEFREFIEGGFRLLNARDLLRYARWRTPLNDRVRVLAVIEEAGSLQIGECLGLFREVAPMTGIAWMFLHRLIDLDLDDAMIGPETVVRRFQR
ncbi:hypothetical protein QTL95_18255 [Rhizobium sp. S152]|uniref:hypothetical protein n=1 Tax=Rhizobium sp. S152 TaxID=3055038 RepID=UPI0025AA2370|nr:hypothetical protein [Rhizobium sp. S152]MDM9627837.1 hypothetical protein [Rhizobium sp. S152]